MPPGRARRFFLPVLLLLALPAGPARSHDPSAWGGLFRSRDDGATWISVNAGPYLSGAIALAISPADANHLLLGTESGLFRSRNGGRDWGVEAPSVLRGSVFAVTFAADGQRALASTGLGLFRGEAGSHWSEAAAPRSAVPARAILRGSEAGRIYLAGWTGLYRSDDGGASWSDIGDGLPQATATALLLLPGRPETLYAVIQGGIWASADGGRSWSGRSAGLGAARIEALAADPRHPARLWAAGGGMLFRSEDAGARWQPAGQPLPEVGTTMYGLAASERTILATTDRGLYRSTDGGEGWTALTNNLPAHLEAGPLLRDPDDPDTLYAGFTLTPYRELWRRAASQEGALQQASAVSLAGGAVVLLLMALGAVAALRWLGRFYRHGAGRAAGGQQIGEGTLPWAKR